MSRQRPPHRRHSAAGVRTGRRLRRGEGGGQGVEYGMSMTGTPEQMRGRSIACLDAAATLAERGTPGSVTKLLLVRRGSTMRLKRSSRGGSASGPTRVAGNWKTRICCWPNGHCGDGGRLRTPSIIHSRYRAFSSRRPPRRGRSPTGTISTATWRGRYTSGGTGVTIQAPAPVWARSGFPWFRRRVGARSSPPSSRFRGSP